MTIKYCRHIKTNGERCASPSLRNEAFCYFHTRTEARHKRMRQRADAVPTILHPMTLQDGNQRNPIPTEPAPLPFDLPVLEDRHSIQLALSLLLTALANNQLDPRRAALLLYGLQIASANAHKLNPEPRRRPAKVSRTILDEATGELIAPDEDPEDPEEFGDYERKGTATRYWEKIQRESAEEKARLEAQQTGDDSRPPFPIPYSLQRP